MTDVIDRIHAALDAALEALKPFDQGRIDSTRKTGGDPVTEADLAVDAVLRELLPRPGEGWLSEETADNSDRLSASAVWIVDPLDGTREFVDGIPEWCVSIGYVVDGAPIAGGIASPARGIRITGAVGSGVEVRGGTALPPSPGIAGALVLASRSEVKRGEWAPVFSTPVSVRNMGSVALKLGLVGAGMADATWTLVPKNEWDVAGGAAIVNAAGGVTVRPDGSPVVFNQPDTLLPGFVATRSELAQPILDLIRSLG
jgi:myo-inositol-1(or 4)-monophosphatase